jgi:type IV pilus assembly protein PilY1
MNMKKSASPESVGRGSLMLFAAFALTAAAGAVAAPLDLARVPLIINASVPPNIVVSLDDSGSMGFGYLPDSADGYGASNCRYYDSDYNKLYFNPDADYPPPLKSNGLPFENATFRSAWWDGFSQSLGSSNLATRYRVSWDHRADEDYSDSDGWRTSGFPSGVSSSGNQRAFYCNGNTVVLIQDRPELEQKFANWFSYYRTRSLAARSAMATAFARLEPSTRVAWQNYRNRTSNGAVQIAGATEIHPLSSATWRSSFFNWLYRGKFNGDTPMPVAFNRAGQFFERSGAASTNPYWDATRREELSCRQNFHVMMTDGYWNVGFSSSIGNYDNQGRGLHDGHTLSGANARAYWNVAAGGSTPPNLADMSMYYWGRDLRSDLENNVPSYYSDRRTGLVTGGGGDDEIYFNPANDPATWQRMVNFMITFGAGGTLTYDNAVPGSTQADVLLRLRNGTTMWPAATSGNGTTIDDAWHAAVNSRGEFLSADNPQQLVDALSAVLDNVNQRQGTSGSAGSSAFQRSDSMIFEASYDSGNWSGDLDAFSINADGSQGAVAWTGGSASAQLDARSPGGSRTILINTARTGIASETSFVWGNLSSEQQDWLNRDPVTGLVDNLGSRRVEFIRGDRSLEQSEAGPFRNRESILGAFLASDLTFVQAPANGYAGRIGFPEGGEQYAQFRQDQKNRAPMLYIGSNDGMLHAFEAGTGHEAWAFIPNKVSRNLARLTTPSYQFVPFVNGTPVSTDVYYNDAWHTILVGTLGLGGQGVFAIDVTNPATPDVLWEFTDENAERLGYTYGQPAITRLSNGTWVALVPGGYNNDGAVDYATRGLPNQTAESTETIGDGRAALFVVNIQTGALIDEFVLPSTANGLASPTVADYEFDFKADFAVAGDLNGNLWRIGLRQDGDAPDYGDIVQIFQGSPDQPITTAPRIFPDPVSGEMIMVVGTGKYLELADREVDSGDPRQAIYGIRECRFRDSCATYPITPNDLVEQELSGASDDFITMNTTHYLDADAAGWSLTLGNTGFLGGALIGERIIDRPLAIFSTGIIVLNSFIPSSDPCAPEGSGVLYILSAFTGGFALPDGVNEDGDQVLPGDPVFEGAASNAVGRFFADRPPTQFFDCPHGGCFVAGGNRFYGKPIIRRSGWREIPTD